MDSSISLSIITPTRGQLDELWLSRLSEIKGKVEFVIVLPPNVQPKSFSDPRFKVVVSPYKGEVIQRFTGLLNASGQYLLALDDDDFIHPDIVKLTEQYFVRFPDSWVLRPEMKKIPCSRQEEITAPWKTAPNIDDLSCIAQKGHASLEPHHLQKIPISPLQNHFNYRFLLWPFKGRTDMHGAHIENFNNKVWRADLVKPALADWAETTHIWWSLYWIPKWSLDRSLGLYIQAQRYQQDIYIGHWVRGMTLIRYVVTQQSDKQEFRLMWPSDALLAKRYPQYGYFWNLFFEQLGVGIKKSAKQLYLWVANAWQRSTAS